MEKKETRGRPKTGQKKTKTVGFRIDEELYEKYEKMAQKNDGVSLHTYAKHNIERIFSDNENSIIYIQNKLKKLEKENSELKKKLEKIKKILVED